MPEPADPILIRHLAPRNFLSFGPDFSGIDLLNLNVLIGPNGSGKSNLIEAIVFMRASLTEWRDVLRKGGGVSEWIWKGGSNAAASMEWNVQKRPRGDTPLPLRHQVAFRAMGQTFEIEQELVENESPKKGGKKPVQYYRCVNGAAVAIKSATSKTVRLARGTLDMQRSIISQRNDPEIYPELAWLLFNYGKIRIYRDWQIGPKSLLRQPQPADVRNGALEEDLSNLGLVLSRFRKIPKAKNAIIENLRSLYEGLTDFDVVAEGGTVQIFFTEGEFVIPASRLSDGTLRFLCLLAILCDPEPPRLICIEEPELGLHPDLLPTIADLLKSASERTQLVVTTHSDILVDAMTDRPESVVVCEKYAGMTEMTRLSRAEMAIWLEKYRLGQLWIQGQLGGTRW